MRTVARRIGVDRGWNLLRTERSRDEERGREYYQAIGRKGGNRTRERFGPEFFSGIGRKGGERVKAERGVEFYAEIGRAGGVHPKRRHRGAIDVAGLADGR